MKGLRASTAGGRLIDLSEVRPTSKGSKKPLDPEVEEVPYQDRDVSTPQKVSRFVINVILVSET